MAAPYVLGLAAIAVLVVAGGLLTALELNRQRADARVAAQAAEQVTRSYQLAQLAIDGEATGDTVAALQRTHLGLLLGDESLGLPEHKSVEIQTRLDAATPYLFETIRLAEEIRAGGDVPATVPTRSALETEAELFRLEMESVVFQYQTEADSGLFSLQQILFALLAATLLLLVLEGLFLFRPAESRRRRRWEETKRQHEEERNRDRERIVYLAHHDSLTGLANHLKFNESIRRAVEHAKTSESWMSVIVVDVDDFGAVNARYDRPRGDELLRAIAERLSRVVRGSDTVAHLGEDAFGLLIEGGDGDKVPRTVARKLLDVVAEPFNIGGEVIEITASVGIVSFSEGSDVSDDLIRDAELAVEAAKRAGRNTFQVYSPRLRMRMADRLQLADELRIAVAAGLLSVEYQPKIDISTGRTIGLEALARWNHPELGPIPPTRFIPVAEESDTIIGLSNWILTEACRQAEAWKAMGLSDLTVSVNISPMQFRRGDLLDSVHRALATTGLDPELLELEVTEGMLLEDTEHTHAVLAELRDMGLAVAVDDFGTGYSSLSYLQSFPLDALKIDQSFIAQISGQYDEAVIPAAIIGLGQSLRLRIIAEGVETSLQLAFLRNQGCDVVQGFYFSPPLPAAEVPTFVAGRSRAVAV